MKNVFLVALIILSSNFCKGQLTNKEEVLNGFWKTDTEKDSIAYIGCSHPVFANLEAIHQSFDKYLDSGKISKMMGLAKTSTKQSMWDKSKVPGIIFISDKEVEAITEGPCAELSKDDLNDTDLVKRYNNRKKVMDKYHNPKGVCYYDMPVFDDAGQYAIFVKELRCCGQLCINMSCYLYQKINGHWTLLAKGDMGYSY